METPFAFDQGLWMGIELIRSAKLRSEINVVEYKEHPHKVNQRCELVKDILGLLNACDIPDGPRFLIYGVSDITREPVGIEYGEDSKRRDSDYQQLLSNLIEPRPIFEYHDIDAHYVIESIPEGERWFGFFYFPEANCQTFFRVKADCHDRFEDGNTRSRTKLMANQSFIRIGSSTKQLNEEDIEQYETRLRNKKASFEQQTILSSKPISCADWRLLLLGKWDESCDEDIAFIEKITGTHYDGLMTCVKENLDSQSAIFSFSDGIWTVADRTHAIEIACARLTSRDLDGLKNSFVEVLASINDRYELPPNQRIMASLFGKGSKYSDSLRKGIAECIAYLANNPGICQLCARTKVESFASAIVWEVLGTDDWRVLASAQDVLPLLAEASPANYVNAIRCSLSKKSAIFDVLNQNEEGLLETTQYGSSLILGIVAAARSEGIFAAAIELLISLMRCSRFAEEAIEKVLLPWCPQTNAPVASRKGCTKKLARRGDDASWRVIFALLPNVTTTTYSLYTPEYLKCNSLPENVSIAEFCDISQSCLHDAMACAGLNAARITELIRRIDAFSAVGMVESFSQHLFDIKDRLDDESRYRIWTSIKLCIDRQRAYCDAAWSLDQNQSVLLETVEDEYKPSSTLLRARRVFEADDFELIQKAEWESAAFELQEERLSLLEELYSDLGHSGIRELLAIGAKERIVGSSCALCSFASELYEDALREIETCGADSEFSKAYVAALYKNDPSKIERHLESRGWSNESIAEYYSAFSCEEAVWSLAEVSLGGDSKLYWSKAPRLFKELDDDQIAHYLTMLNSVNRNGEAIQEIGHCLYTERRIDSQVALSTLEGYKPSQPNDFALHFVDRIFDFLEESPVDKARLFNLEWAFFGVIDNRPNAYIFQALAESPSLFVEMIGLDCGAATGALATLGDSNNNNAASQAYRVLMNWRIQPGLNNGQIDRDIFDAWVDEVNRLIPEERRASAWMRLGANLFHSPSDKCGFFIDKTAAAFLEENDAARTGFEMESVNSRGVVWVDKAGTPEDNLAVEYDEKAEAAEAEGFFAFASTLRSISSDFRRNAQRLRESPWY